MTRLSQSDYQYANRKTYVTYDPKTSIYSYYNAEGQEVRCTLSDLPQWCKDWFSYEDYHKLDKYGSPKRTLHRSATGSGSEFDPLQVQADQELMAEEGGSATGSGIVWETCPLFRLTPLQRGLARLRGRQFILKVNRLIANGGLALR